MPRTSEGNRPSLPLHPGPCRGRLTVSGCEAGRHLGWAVRLWVTPLLSRDSSHQHQGTLVSPQLSEDSSHWGHWLLFLSSLSSGNYQALWPCDYPQVSGDSSHQGWAPCPVYVPDVGGWGCSQLRRECGSDAAANGGGDAGAGGMRVHVHCECKVAEGGAGWAPGVAGSGVRGYLAWSRTGTGGESLGQDLEPYSEQREPEEPVRALGGVG